MGQSDRTNKKTLARAECANGSTASPLKLTGPPTAAAAFINPSKQMAQHAIENLNRWYMEAKK
jgi:hypothetical protein